MALVSMCSTQILPRATSSRTLKYRRSMCRERWQDLRGRSTMLPQYSRANSRARIVWYVYVRVPAWQVEPPGPCPGLRPSHGGGMQYVIPPTLIPLSPSASTSQPTTTTKPAKPWHLRQRNPLRVSTGAHSVLALGFRLSPPTVPCRHHVGVRSAAPSCATDGRRAREPRRS